MHVFARVPYEDAKNDINIGAVSWFAGDPTIPDKEGYKPVDGIVSFCLSITMSFVHQKAILIYHKVPVDINTSYNRQSMKYQFRRTLFMTIMRKIIPHYSK